MQNQPPFVDLSKSWSYRVEVTTEEPRIRQFSDEGRTPLGKYDDEESVKVRKMLESSVPPSVLAAWESYTTLMREKHFEVIFKESNSEKSKGTFPIKERKFEEAQEGEGEEYDEEDLSKQRHEILDKYKLIRKVAPSSKPDQEKLSQLAAASQSSASLVHPAPKNLEKVVQTAPSTSEPSIAVEPQYSPPTFQKKKEDAIKAIRSFIKKRTIDPAIVLGISTKTTTKDAPPVVQVEKEVEEPPCSDLLADYGFPKTNVLKQNSIPNRAPSPDIVLLEECILNKYGHCWKGENCQFTHSGNVKRVRLQAVSKNDSNIQKWEKKNCQVEICPGYLNRKCWKMSCNLRHVLYPSDPI